MNNNENKLINIIRYTPPVFIIIISLILYFVLKNEHNKNFLEEKRDIQIEYLNNEKNRIKTTIDKTVSDYLQRTEKNTTSKLKKELKSQVSNAYNIANNIYNKYKHTKTKKEITELIKETLREIRFLNKRGYFFIYELDGTNILNAAFPKIEGKELWNYTDTKGTPLIQEMNKILSKKDETYYEWYWNKPNDKTTEYKKLGFFKKFEPYGWYIGTGEYIKDFKGEIQNQVKGHLEKLRYKDGGYIFILDTKGNILTTQNKQFIDSNIFTDKRFKNFKDELVNLKTKNIDQGFISYKLIAGEEKKISYFKKFEKWNWYIGTGFYVKNIDKIILKRQIELKEKYDTYLNDLLAASFVLIVVLLFISYLVSRYLQKIFNKHTSNLEAQRDKLIKAQRVAQMGEWELNLDTNEANWSDEIIHILGLSDGCKEKCGPEFLKQIMNEEDWPKFESSITNTIKTGAEHRAIYRVKKENGDEIWVDCKGKINKKTNTILGIIQDITEMKKRDQLLADQSKLAAMGEMIGNIAHQWRQPLSVISTGATGMVVSKEHNILTDKVFFETCEQIEENAQYLSKTIDDFRNFIKGDSTISTFNLKDQIESFIKLVTPSIKSYNINLITDLDESINIKGYPSELNQCLINLFNNAKDALIENNKEDNRYIFISSKKSKDTITIEIKDNAGGIKEEIIKKIFEPYFTTKHESKGTGLGLHMTYNLIVNGMNGTIIASNTTYKHDKDSFKGALFTVTLPNK